METQCHIVDNYETYLHHQADNKNHCNTTNDIRMILNDKLMAQNWWVLFILFIAEWLRSEC